jgi:putative aldouronate transport system substrate-binding protein
MVLKYIIGTESLDSWDAFVKTVQDMGIDQAVAVTQAAYDRYMAVTVK